MTATTTKRPTSFKLSDTATELLSKLAAQSGNSKTATLERLLREEAERKGVIANV